MVTRSHTWDDPGTVQYTVYCHICGHGWLEQDPGVRFRFVDHVWECYDEAMCFERRAMAEPLRPGVRG
jgi:hypothetical protein